MPSKVDRWVDAMPKQLELEKMKVTTGTNGDLCFHSTTGWWALSKKEAIELGNWILANYGED